MLKLFMFLLQLFGFLQRAGCDQTSVQHWLAIPDPSQHLKQMDTSCYPCYNVTFELYLSVFANHRLNCLTHRGCHSIIVLSAQLRGKSMLNTDCLRTSVWLSMHTCRGGNEQIWGRLLPIKLMMQSSSGFCLPASSTKSVFFLVC